MNMDYLTDKFSLDGKVALITGASYGIGKRNGGSRRNDRV